MCSLPKYFRTRTLYEFISSPTRAACPTHLILLDLVRRVILVNSSNHEALRSVIFSSFLLLPSQTQVPSSAHFFQIRNMMLHTRIKIRKKKIHFRQSCV